MNYPLFSCIPEKDKKKGGNWLGGVWIFENWFVLGIGKGVSGIYLVYGFGFIVVFPRVGRKKILGGLWSLKGYGQVYGGGHHFIAFPRAEAFVGRLLFGFLKGVEVSGIYLVYGLGTFLHF